MFTPITFDKRHPLYSLYLINQQYIKSKSPIRVYSATRESKRNYELKRDVSCDKIRFQPAKIGKLMNYKQLTMMQRYAVSEARKYSWGAKSKTYKEAYELYINVYQRWLFSRTDKRMYEINRAETCKS